MEGDHTAVYRNESEGVLTKIKVFEEKGVFPDKINVNGEEITIIMGALEGLVAEYSIAVSDDDGKTWRYETPPVSLVMKPFAFYKNSLWAYAGAGMIQIRE